ncbi:Na+/H+ exchanger family and Cation/H+ exchanger domain-containing protein [Strongyloides ratti]|uniref:Sodium/hydrogen exchanger n=1 Tax=Strongyloides ratti TaxID=34506 RepID=A0A090MYB0_STRRB|nr:Na+/H+ exchanger family and Cation/H+ exchanger domain-containing protein [Strongyloides ratti]CEF66869.1 Na+/H+ exchanger family and Cation/H+ exchanger domain-containing protein [Strongyloides ratti]
MTRGTKISTYILFIIFIIGLTVTWSSIIEAIPIHERNPNNYIKTFYPYEFYNSPYKRGNAEIMNGLLAMDLGQLSAVGKRSNAELINGLIGMDLDGLYSAGNVTYGNENTTIQNGSEYHIFSNNFSHVSTPYTVSMWLIIAAVAKIFFNISKKFSDTFPDSALLIVVGLILGFVLKKIHVDSSIFTLDSTTFFIFLLPPIIFDAGYFMPNRALFENVDSVLLFAVVGTIFNTICIGSSLYTIGYMGYFSLPFSIFEILCFSALISAVDPVAVIAVFEEIHVNEFLFINLFGEALFNDGVTVVLYQMFKQFLLIGTENVTPMDYVKGGISFPVIAFGGTIIGIIFAFIVSLLTKYSQKVVMMAPVFVFVLPYLSYLTAESFGLSSILAITSCGMLMKQYVKENITQSASSSVKYFVKMFAHSSETAIFMFLGLSTISSGKHHWDTAFIVCTLVFCLFFRAIGIIVQCWILNKFKKEKFSVVDQFVLSYSGLRGAIAYGLVVSLPDNILAKDMYVTATVAEIFFTVFVQGITIKPLLNFLDVKKKDDREKTMLETVYSRYFDYAVSGIEDIAGLKGKNFFRASFERLNAQILKPLFIRKAKRGKFDASHIIRTFKKITIEEALKEKENRPNERQKSALFFTTSGGIPSPINASINLGNKITGTLEVEKALSRINSIRSKGTSIISEKQKKNTYQDIEDENRKEILNEILKYLPNETTAEILTNSILIKLNKTLNDMAFSYNYDDSDDSDIEDNYLKSMQKKELHHILSHERLNTLNFDRNDEIDSNDNKRRTKSVLNTVSPVNRPRSSSISFNFGGKKSHEYA